MPGCVFRYCKKNTNNTGKADGVTFHRFPRPTEATLREHWIKIIQDDRREEYWLPSEASRICSQHFNEKDLQRTKTNRCFLKKGAVPCARIDTNTRSTKSSMPSAVRAETPPNIPTTCTKNNINTTSTESSMLSMTRAETPPNIPITCTKNNINTTSTESSMLSMTRAETPPNIPITCTKNNINTTSTESSMLSMTRAETPPNIPITCTKNNINIRSTESPIPPMAATATSAGLSESDSEILVHVSDSESIFDTPRKIGLKCKLRKQQILRKKCQQKLKKVQRQLRYTKKRNQTLKNIIESLKKQNKIEEEVVIGLKANAEIIDLFHSLKQSKMTKKNSPFCKKYSSHLRKFALTLHYHSPSAYKYARDAFNKRLPHPRTLSRWYGAINGEPGFTKEAFDALKIKSETSKTKLPCALIFDEMAIRQQKIWNGKRKVGFVDLGLGGQDEDEMATQSLVFMIVSLNENWKIPVAYFLIVSAKAELKASLIKTCLEKCNDVGVEVKSITFDGCRANLKCAENLGCDFSDPNSLKTSFPHPVTGASVVVFLDPAHMIKLIRNTFEKKKILIDSLDRKIRWQLIKNLNILQQNEGLTFANKLSVKHIEFRNQIMKVYLATQLLSKSVAKAIELCEKDLKSPLFTNTEGTVDFLLKFNHIFDVLNSRKCHFYGYKRSLDNNNKTEIFDLMDEVKKYILSLTYQDTKTVINKKPEPRIILKVFKQKILDSNSKTGFLGILIDIESLKTLYRDVVETRNQLKYISVYRISQDHLELFFGCIRKHGGFNNNPNVVQFQAAYKKTLCHLELRSSFRGNCIPLENFSILSTSSVNVINITSGTYRHKEDEEIVQEENIRSDKEAESNCVILSTMLDSITTQSLTNAARVIIGYISGFVSRKLIKQIKCEICMDSLITSRKMYFHKLITFKDMGGLVYSSEDVFKVCMLTESCIRRLLREKGMVGQHNIQQVQTLVLGKFVNSDIFNGLLSHTIEQPATFNHRTHIIRAIIQIYSNVKLHHSAKMSSYKPSIRQKHTKLTLFQGQ